MRLKLDAGKNNEGQYVELKYYDAMKAFLRYNLL